MTKLFSTLLTMLAFSLVLIPQNAWGKGPALFEPLFVFSNGDKITAGKAWCAKVGEKTLAVTALHLLGPDGGVPKQIPAKRVGSHVRQVDFYAKGRKYFSSTRTLSKSGYVTNGPDFSGDVVFFEAPKAMASSAFNLAPKLPKLKDPIWIYTKIQGGAVKAYPGFVINTSSIMLQVKLYKPIMFKATSGSPVLDKNGKVLGLICAVHPNRRVFICNPSIAILKRIKKDLRNRN